MALTSRTKKLKDDKEKEGENGTTVLFFATAKCKTIMKVTIMAYPTNLEDLTFEKISQKYDAQENVSYCRKNEMSMKQEIVEPIINIYTGYQMRVDIAILKNFDKKNRRL